MLKRKALNLAIATLLSVPALLSSVASAQPICGALSESALFMMDYSGSMMQPNKSDERPIIQSKQILLEIIESLPKEAKLAMGVTSFAPHAILVTPQIYSSENLIEKIEKLPDNMEVMGRHTNLGEGLMGYKDRVEKLSLSPNETDKTLAHQMTNDARLIILTDGGTDNRGRKAKDVIDEFTKSLPNVHLAVISFSQDQKQLANLNQLIEGKDISFYLAKNLLEDSQQLEKFIRQELYYPCDEINFSLSSDVLFGFDQSRLTDKGKKVLEAVATDLLKNKELLEASNVRLEITAHTDKIGSQAYNQLLSEQRLDTVLKTLKQLGAPMEIFAQRKAMGEKVSITKDKCKGIFGLPAIKCLQPDRRVEIRTYKEQ